MTTPETSYEPINYTSNDYEENEEEIPETGNTLESNRSNESTLNRPSYTFRTRIRLPQLSPRRTTRVSKSCSLCAERDYELFSKKHNICYDCLVEKLSTAKLFSQGFNVHTKRNQKTCIVCLNMVKCIGNRYLVCIDCLIQRLGDLGLLKFKKASDINPEFIVLEDFTGTRDLEWMKKRYYPCDVCREDNIPDNQTERICMNCLVDNLLSTPYFCKKERRIYN